MQNKTDGGAAFPVEFNHIPKGSTLTTSNHPGMSLRDWFAGMAMGSVIQTSVRLGIAKTDEDISSYCYGLADAMIREREK